MPVWEDDGNDTSSRLPGTTTGAPAQRAREDVRIAAQQDAAEIVARARRDISRIVTEARRDLLELSAQVRAANIDLPDSALSDPRLLAPEELPDVSTPPAWLQTTPSRQSPPRTEFILASDDAGRARLDLSAVHTFTPPDTKGPARTFVALFALAGVLIVAGSIWFLSRGVGRTSSPPPPPAASGPQAPPSAEPAQEAVPAPAEPATLVGISIELEARRPTWVRKTVDGQADAGRIYDTGEVLRIQNAGRVTLRAGDAGGVLLSVNGSSPEPFGPDGVSLTRQFGEDARTPAPVEPSPSPAPPASVASPAPMAQAAADPQAVGLARTDVSVAGRQWVDAYHRQDRTVLDMLGLPETSVADIRRADQRFFFGLAVTRTFDNEQLQLSGDTAVFTSLMTERASTGALTSRVSQTWVRRQGQWYLREARFDPEAPPSAPVP